MLACKTHLGELSCSLVRIKRKKRIKSMNEVEVPVASFCFWSGLSSFLSLSSLRRGIMVCLPSPSKFRVAAR
jgi:hypothetical protein